MTTESILKAWGVTKYKIHKDGSVDILQNLDLRGKLTTPEFPFVIRKVTGYLDLTNTPIQSLGALKSVGEWLWLANTPIQSLGALESVGGNLYLANTPIQSLGALESVGGSLDLENTPIQSLGALESVGGWLYLENDKGYPDWKVFQKELEAYKLRAHECLEDVPLMLATAELAWQRACCEQAIRRFSA